VSERARPGLWQPGVAPGGRLFIDLLGGVEGGLALEFGGRLAELTVAYEHWGTLNAERTNGVLVLHALTMDSHASGPAGPGHVGAGWWEGLIGPGLALDTDHYFVI